MKMRILAIAVLVIVVVSSAFYYFTISPRSVAKSVITVATSTPTVAVRSESEIQTQAVTPTKDVVAHIADLSGNMISLDYVDAIPGEEGVKAMIADGKCSEGSSEMDCYGTPPFVYFRNVNAKLRVFPLAPDVKVINYFDKSITLKELQEGVATKGYGSSWVDDKGTRSGFLFTVSFNAKGEVQEIKGIFMP